MFSHHFRFHAAADPESDFSLHHSVKIRVERHADLITHERGL